jgi:hypothetical protein
VALPRVAPARVAPCALVALLALLALAALPGPATAVVAQVGHAKDGDEPVPGAGAAAGVAAGPDPSPGDASCRDCHAGIEEMHPWEPLSCTDCHGGDGRKADATEAHVAPRIGWPQDERVLERGFDPAAVRFRNPGDLRVAEGTCGACHPGEVARVKKSLHATTAGHLCDGLYENGLLERRGSRYAVFAQTDDDAGQSGHGLAKLEDIARLRVPREPRGLGDHFADLPRKACMQCHLWSEGVAVTGRLGQDGLYRGGGCSACHVPYAQDGRSRSADARADRLEPGHPVRHAMTAAPPAGTCFSCHVGDASVGNGFRGLAQLYPQQPAGPDIPNTTDELIAGQFFVRDPVLTPPDLHHAAGMDCIDCHSGRDVMGDGQMYGQMEHAVEIECTSCHGTFDAASTLRTSRDRPVTNLGRRGDLVVLTGRVDGTARRVKQARDVLDPDHPDWNPRAAAAMTPEHAGLECYACHAGWSTNYFGFHFDRNLAFTQLDLITGQRSKGRVSTQERVFATLRHLTLGVNPEGAVAPYLVGFSSMGTVRGEDGGLLLDQALPATSAGMSGMTMVHHQLHTTQPVARSCVECHRSPAAWGLGTGDHTTSSFALARGLLVVAGERGVDTLLLDRENPESSAYVARLPLGGAQRVILDSDAVTGEASTAFVVVEHAGVALVDVRNPAFPRMRAFAAAGDARDVALAGDLLVVANGAGGVRLVDVSDRDQPRLVSDLVTRQARGVAVQWPRVIVADGEGGLLVADVSVPSRPRVTGQLAIVPEGIQDVDGDARAVAALFQQARPQGAGPRTTARMIAVVANGRFGVSVVDVTEPEAASVLSPPARYAAELEAVDVELTGRFDLGDTTGVKPTVERDVAYLVLAAPDGTRGATLVLDVSVPSRPAPLGRVNLGPGSNLNPLAGGTLVRSFNPPVLVTRLAVAGEGGVLIQDVTASEEPRNEARLVGVPGARHVAAEAFAFDRMVDETGRQLKDISHEGARYFTPEEIFRVLTVPSELLGDVADGGARRERVAARHEGAATPGGRLEASVRPSGLSEEDAEAMLARLAGGFRIAPQEDLARLVRHAWPPDHDRNGDAALSRGELEALVFDVLDANGDGRLDALEWPRHPGESPQALDRNGDGVVSRQEMDLGPEVMRFFDPDGDGKAAFAEWPFTVEVAAVPSLYYTTVEQLLALLGRQGFERARPALFALLCGDEPPHDVERERLEAFVARARAQPLTDAYGRPAAPGFLERWDVDGDGAVGPEEHPAFGKLARRCDRNGDGRIDKRDR